MGPLVPELIGNELNYIVAILIGMAFGFVLEQAGFSTSKKLVGLFYGYDFTVLRVFFTAGVTAMLGLIIMGHYGIIDSNLIFINPLFMKAALVGGVIMGLGFVIGGYCPGTAVCAAGIGKIDAMVFILGSYLGVLAFGEGYPWFEQLYKADPMGGLRLYTMLGISQSLFAFALTAVAVGAFWAVSVIENRVNGIKDNNPKLKRIYMGVSGFALILGLSAFLFPDKNESILKNIEDASFVSSYKINTMTSDELAFRVIDEDANVQIIDVRDAKTYAKETLPHAINLSVQSLFDKETLKKLTIKSVKNVFIADDETLAKKSAIAATELGASNVYVLNGGLNKFKKDILEFDETKAAPNYAERDSYRFRAKAKLLIPELIKKAKQKQSEGGEKKSKRVVGGC